MYAQRDRFIKVVKFPIKFETADQVGSIDERETLGGAYGQNTLASPCQRCKCPYSTHLLWYRDKDSKSISGHELRICPKCVESYLVPLLRPAPPGFTLIPARKEDKS